MRKLHALVIDDSGLSRKVIERALRDSGAAEFRFTEFEDGMDALEAARSGDVDIMFVDMHMARMGGVEFLKRLHSAGKPSPPAVMVTAETNSELLAEAVNQAGVDALLLKPVDGERFRRGLKTLIQSIPERSGSWSVPHGECAVQAMTEALRRSCEISLTPDPEGESRSLELVVLGMFVIMGDVLWSVTLGMDGPAAEDVATRFGGFPLTMDHPEIGDAIGEVTNITAGQLKRLLNQRGLSVEISLPSVLSVRDVRMLVHHGKRSTVDAMRFRSPAGRIWISVTLGKSPGLIL